MVYCLLLILLTRKVWAALMHCLPWISHNLQESLDAGMESYIVQFDFSTAFDRGNHSGLLFKLKSIVGLSVMPICTKFLANFWHRVVVAVSAREWIPIISGMPQGSVLGPLLFILYTSEMFELVENTLFAYADHSTLLAVVHKPAELFASLLLLPPLTGSWLGFMSGAFTGI